MPEIKIFLFTKGQLKVGLVCQMPVLLKIFKDCRFVNSQNNAWVFLQFDFRKVMHRAWSSVGPLGLTRCNSSANPSKNVIFHEQRNSEILCHKSRKTDNLKFFENVLISLRGLDNLRICRDSHSRIDFIFVRFSKVVPHKSQRNLTISSII